VENGDRPIVTSIVVRPLGSGLPLGFFSFALGMLILCGLGVGWIEPADEHSAALLLITFVAPLEFAATVIAFLARDSIGATTLGVFSGSWFASGWTIWTGVPGTLDRSFGLFLCGFAVVIVCLATLSWSSKPLFAVLLTVSALRMALAATYEFGAGHTWLVAAGWDALALFVLAVYGGLALAFEDIERREVLPLFRRGAARTAFEGSLAEQLERIESEPGVRQQL
jgi:succinate-acetate transporter protein